jgi:hypothetical protein
MFRHFLAVNLVTVHASSLAEYPSSGVLIGARAYREFMLRINFLTNQAQYRNGMQKCRIE